MAGFHSTASDAWLHAKDQNLGHFLIFGPLGLGLGQKEHRPEGTFSSLFIYQN